MTDVKNLKRDSQAITANLKKLPDGRVVCLEACKIHIPARFEEKNMAYLGMENYILGLYAMIVGDKYAVSAINAMIPIDPTTVEKVKINGDTYLEFHFNKGAVVFKSLKLVKTDSIPYKIYDEMFSKGYIPWYMGYEDLAKVFDTAKYHTGANIGQNKEITELIVSLIARDKQDKTKYYRTTIDSLEDIQKKPPEFISLRNVTYSATNTTNRLGGSYMSVGIIGALNNPSDRPERIETLLRR